MTSTKSIKTHRYFVALIVVALAIASHFYLTARTITWTKTLTWHLFHKDTVSFYNAEIHLPFRWWVIGRSKDEIRLAMVPSDRNVVIVMVFFTKKVVPEEELKKKYTLESRKVEEQTLEFNGYKVDTIGGKKAFGVRYLDNQKKQIFEYWTLPIEGFTIGISRLPEGSYPSVWDFISTKLLLKGKSEASRIVPPSP